MIISSLSPAYPDSSLGDLLDSVSINSAFVTEISQTYITRQIYYHVQNMKYQFNEIYQKIVYYAQTDLRHKEIGIAYKQQPCWLQPQRATDLSRHMCH